MTVEVARGDRPGFFGRSAVLVDGGDVFPALRAAGPSCGLYEAPEGRRSSSIAVMFRTAIEEEKRAQAEAP